MPKVVFTRSDKLIKSKNPFAVLVQNNCEKEESGSEFTFTSDGVKKAFHAATKRIIEKDKRKMPEDELFHMNVVWSSPTANLEKVASTDMKMCPRNDTKTVMKNVESVQCRLNTERSISSEGSSQMRIWNVNTRKLHVSS